MNLTKETIKKYLLLMPSIIVVVMFFLVPFGLLFIMSLTERESFFFIPKYTLDNYLRGLTFYASSFRLTFVWAACASCINILLGYPFAYLITRKIKYRTLINGVLLVPLFGELYIAFGLWYLFLPGGPLAFLFEMLGIPVFKALYAAPSAILAIAIATFPFAVLQMYVAISGIDPVYEDAANCLGANPVMRFFKVTLPLSLPGILSGFFMSFGWGIGAYTIPILMGGVVGQKYLSVQIWSIALLTMNYGLASALATILAILSVVFCYLAIKITRGL